MALFSLATKEEEEHDLAKVMMSRKASRLYGRMQRGIAQKKAGAEVLHKRRKELEREEREKAKTSKPVDEGSTPVTKKSKKDKEEKQGASSSRRAD